MAKGTGQYVGGFEVTQNNDGSYNVPGIGVVSGPSSGGGAGSSGGSSSGGYSSSSYADSSGSLTPVQPEKVTSKTKSSPWPGTGIDNNNYFEGMGYAYTDKYGFPHVTNDYEAAARYARDALGPTTPWTTVGGETYDIFTAPGSVYAYEGPYSGGYAVNVRGNEINRLMLPLPGAVPFGNDSRGIASSPASPGSGLSLETLVPSAIRSRYEPTTFEGPFWAGDVDIDLELTRLGYNPSMYSPEQKQAIIAAIKQLQGGR